MTIPPTEIPARPVPRVAKELLKSSGFLLARVGIGFKTQALAKLEEWGFDPYDYSVLAILAEGAREAQATIADTLGLDPSRVVAVLDSLEQRELVERQRDPHDRRRHVVSITPSGKRQLSRLRTTMKELEDEFFAPLDAETRERLHELLFVLACHHDPRCAFKSQDTA
jgi:DNA-binding MarR family transcriptional regulator